MRNYLKMEDEHSIREFLNNFGFDKHLYPFLNKAYNIQIFSEKNISTKIKSNFITNFDYVTNNLMLKNRSSQDKNKADYSTISFKQDNIHIEGIKNNNKKEGKYFTLDFSGTTGAVYSTNYHTITKQVNPNQAVFFMYIVCEKPEDFKKIVRVGVENVIEIENSKSSKKKLKKMSLSLIN